MSVEKEKGTGQSAAKGKVVMAWIFVILALIYDINPVDILPDIPVIGWMDDSFLTLITVINLLQQKSRESGHAETSRTMKALKWLFIVFGIVVVFVVIACLFV